MTDKQQRIQQLIRQQLERQTGRDQIGMSASWVARLRRQRRRQQERMRPALVVAAPASHR